MRKWLAPLAFLLAVSAVAVAASTVPVSPTASSPSAVVKLAFKVMDPMFGERDSHCSGTHIGGGVVLTAEHCTRNGAIEVVDNHGARTKADVLWAAKGYDLAILQAENLPIAKARVSCKLAPVGSVITVSGHPHDLEWISTRGPVLTGIISDQTWKEIVAADVTGGGGSSGGPVLDLTGNVIGVLVGGYTRMRVALFVPGPTICKLLGRA